MRARAREHPAPLPPSRPRLALAPPRSPDPTRPSREAAAELQHTHPRPVQLGRAPACVQPAPPPRRSPPPHDPLAPRSASPQLTQEATQPVKMDGPPPRRYSRGPHDDDRPPRRDGPPPPPYRDDGPRYDRAPPPTRGPDRRDDYERGPPPPRRRYDDGGPGGPPRPHDRRGPPSPDYDGAFLPLSVQSSCTRTAADPCPPPLQPASAVAPPRPADRRVLLAAVVAPAWTTLLRAPSETVRLICSPPTALLGLAR